MLIWKCGCSVLRHTSSCRDTFRENPISYLDYQLTGLGRRDEVCRTDHSTFGVAPPQESLRFADLAATQIHNRLEMQLKLLLCERIMQVIGDAGTLHSGLMQGGCEETESVASGSLGFVHRLVPHFFYRASTSEPSSGQSVTPMLADTNTRSRCNSNGLESVCNSFCSRCSR